MTTNKAPNGTVELIALREGMTPGPWDWQEHHYGASKIIGQGDAIASVPSEGVQGFGNALAIAALPDLLDLLSHLQTLSEDAGYAGPVEAIEGVRAMRLAMHEIDIVASNTIPPDGKEAAFAALGEIIKLLNPFRLALQATPNNGGSCDR